MFLKKNILLREHGKKKRILREISGKILTINVKEKIVM